MWSTKRAIASLAAATALAGIAGCSPSLIGADAKPDPLNPGAQYSLQVEERPDEVALRPHPEGLSTNQRAALAAFVDRWRTAGGGDIVIDSPSTGADPNAISRTAAAILTELQALGAPSTALRFSAYEAGNMADAPVVARYASYTLHRDDCSKTWDNLVSTGKNNVSSHLGCVTNANMAAQIARPQDVAAPAVTQAADATRRSTVLDKYRKGEITSAKRDEQAATQLSGAVRQ
jgi:pilus assembly protein CpaD